MPAFSVSSDNGIAEVRLSRPEASNALDAEFWGRFAPTLDALDCAGTTRALVISGEGKNFCAGMDLSAFAGGGITQADTPSARESFQHAARYLQDVISTIEQVRFPVIAAIQGACVGAGLELAAACDLRFISADAYFRIEEINIGMMADLGSLQRLPKLMPEAVVKEMAFMGTTLGADRAAALGFVTSVAASTDEALTNARSAAERIASKAPLAIAGSKAALRYARDHDVAQGLEWAAMMQSAIWNTADIGAAVQARVQKQPAVLAPLAEKRHIGG